MNPLLRSAALVAFHDGAAKDTAPRHREGLWQAIEANHHCNCVLWDEEDLARRRDVPDAEIAGNKRAIDAANQKRNDAIERMDECLLEVLKKVETKPSARLHSETPGAMIDRLSILSLKIRAMRLQTQRTDADPELIESCKSRLARLTEQRSDLAGCLDALLEEAARGAATFKVYRQFKMYNDPKLNPALYGAARHDKRS